MTQFDQRYQQVEIQYNADQITIQQQPLSLTERQRKQNRSRMLDRVQAIWIEGVLEPSVQGTALIALELEHKPSAVVTPLWQVLREFDKTGRLSSADASIVQVYDHASGEVLILGEPGAGKTTLLLELTRDLLERARREEAYPIPVVFNLSSWAQTQQPLAEWLASELVTRYQVTRALATSWIQTDQVLPLLDGLDEVAAPHRGACVEAINTYRQGHGLLPTVICCRQTNYLALPIRLLLRTAVVVQPLTSQQVESYLASSGERLEALHQVLQKDADLQALATTPLMLNVLTVAYQGIPSEEIVATGSLGSKREQILATYVQRMLERRGISACYPPKQTIHWLSWLAWQMKRHNQTEFYLERMQPDWLPTPWIRWVYRVSIGVLVGLLCLFIALLAGLIFGTSSVGQSTGLLVGLYTGFPIALVSGFLSGLRREITPAERVTWSWKRALWGYSGTGLVIGWPLLLILSLAAIGSQVPSTGPSPPVALSSSISIIITLLLLPLLIGLINGLRIKVKPFRVAWSWKRLLWGYGGCWLFFFWLSMTLSSLFPSPLLLLLLLIGLINGLRINTKPFRVAWSWKRTFRGELVIACLPALFAALLGGPLVGLFFGLSGNTLEKHIFIRPNGGIWRSARNSIRYGATVGITLLGVLLIVVLIVASIGAPEPKWQFLGELWISYLLPTLPFVLPVIMIVVLTIALIVGGSACIQHITLHVFLRRKGSVPWNYPQFLDYAAERILLRKVGGGYIFLHRLLLDYFAAQETAPVFNEPAEHEQASTPAPVSPSNVLSELKVPAVLPDLSAPTISLAPPAALSETRHSLPCGHELRTPGARFCSVCGASLTMPHTPT